MSNKLSLQNTLKKIMQVTKEYVDRLVDVKTEEETMDLLLENGLVADAIMLDDGTYLVDENNKLIQL